MMAVVRLMEIRMRREVESIRSIKSIKNINTRKIKSTRRKRSIRKINIMIEKKKNTMKKRKTHLQAILCHH